MTITSQSQNRDAKLQEIEQRLLKITYTNRLLLMAIAVLFFVAAAKPAHKIQAQQLSIVDKSGNELLVLGSDAQGGQVVLNDKRGKEMLRLSALDSGGAFSINNTAETLVLATQARGEGADFLLFNNGGQLAMGAAAADNGGVVQVLSPNQVPVATMSGGGSGGGRVEVRNLENRLSFSVEANRVMEPEFHLYNSAGRAAVSAGLRSGAGWLTTHGPQGRTRWATK